MMDGTFVKELERISRAGVEPKFKSFDDGRTYYLPFSGAMVEVSQPTPNALEVNTLGGLLEAISHDPLQGMTNLKANEFYIHVADAQAVYYRGPILDPWKKRPILISAIPAFTVDWDRNTEMDLERFIVFLQTNFVQTDERDALLQTLTQVDIKEDAQYGDDGMSMNVVTKSGVVRKNRGEVKNPVFLRPYRTFPEIEQPQSPFIVRLKKTGDEKTPVCRCTLEDAGGGAWILGAMSGIQNWLSENIDGRKDVTGELRIVA